MEDTQNQDSVQVIPPQNTSFSVEPRQKGGNAKWLVIFILLLILGGVGIFFFTKSSEEEIPTPTPTFSTTPIVVRDATSTPTSSPVAIKRSEVAIEIKNGTGITGEAAFLKEKLVALGYSDIKAGNAETTDNTVTQVTFLKTLAQSAQDEIKKELEKIYTEVTVKQVTSQTSEVIVVTGTRTSQSPKSTVTSSASPKASVSPTPKVSPTATPSL